MKRIRLHMNNSVCVSKSIICTLKCDLSLACRDESEQKNSLVLFNLVLCSAGRLHVVINIYLAACVISFDNNPNHEERKELGILLKQMYTNCCTLKALLVGIWTGRIFTFSNCIGLNWLSQIN